MFSIIIDVCALVVGTDEDRHTLNIIKIIQGVQNPASNVLQTRTTRHC
jgi:hypothetical protein